MSAVCQRCGDRWSRHPVLEVACPTCQQPIGSWCQRPSGHRAPELHVDREQLAVDTGVLAICRGPSSETAREGDQFRLIG